MLKTRLSTCGTGNTLKFLFKNRKGKKKKKKKKNRKINGSPQFRFRGMLSAHQKFGTIWVKTVGVVPEQTNKQTNRQTDRQRS